MCTHPIRIKNKKIDFNVNLDKKYLEVPCGTCIECRNARRREWEYRAYYEYLYTKEIGGVCYYYTFTYNDENIPHTFVGNKRVLHFDKEQVQRFKHALDMFCRRNFGFKIRYFITSEYGGNGTHRPHHHALFYLDKYISPLFFHQLLLKYWTYGFIMPGHNRGIVENINAVRYVAKYVSKDVFFFKKVSHLLENNEDYKKLKPFFLNSQNFGIYALSTLSDNQKQLGLCYYPSLSNTSLNEFILPTYLIRKLFYNVEKNSHGNNSYVLNEFGIHRKKLLLDKLIESDSKEYECNLQLLPYYLRETNNFELVNQLFGIDIKYQSDNINQIINAYVPKEKFKDVAVFHNVYQGRPVYPCFVSENYKEMFKFFLQKVDNEVFNPLFIDSNSIYDDDRRFNFFVPFLILQKELNNFKRFINYKKSVEKYNSLQYQRHNKGKYKESHLLYSPTFDEFKSKYYEFN